MGQRPQPGQRVPPRSAVQVQVGTAPAPPIEVMVPSLIGLTEDEARQRLGQSGLRLGGVERRESDSRSAGRVMGQRPQPGQRVPPRSAVQVQVGTAPAPPIEVMVPSLIGLTEDEAAQRLGQSGLRLGGVERRESDSRSAGRVMGQRPQPGQRVPPRSAVQVQVGTAPAPPIEVMVPSLIGLTEDEAAQRLSEVGLGLRKVGEDESEEVTAGRVLRQEPGAGSRAGQGMEVRVWLARRPGTSQPTSPSTQNGDGRGSHPALLGALAALAVLVLGTPALVRWRGKRGGGAALRLASVADPGSQEVGARCPEPLHSFTLRMHAQKDSGMQEVLAANPSPPEDSHD